MRHKQDYLIKKCKNKKVLHIGPTDFPFHREKEKQKKLLYQRINEVAKKQWGLDINKDAINYLKKRNIKNIIYGDITKKIPTKIIKQNFDIILFCDVIEHLNNPGFALENIKKIMNPKTELILTTNNCWFIGNIINFFKKKESVHPDHTFWPSKKTLNKLITNSGLYAKKTFFSFSGHSSDKRPLIYKIIKYLIQKTEKQPVIIIELKK
jgi:SAM-dependent methyltransferase